MPHQLVNPTSPHIIGTSLTSDTCAACHDTHDASASRLLDTTYRIDPLRSSGEPYRSADFALCWSCHSATKAAIEDATGATAGTNFPSHGFHLKGIGSYGSGGTDITVAGDGQGNALCAECHYNLHGTAASEQGLVVFAPNVEPYNGQPITYDPASGSCTLTCHGVAHSPAGVPAPALAPIIGAGATEPSATPTPAVTAPPTPTPALAPTVSASPSPAPSPTPAPASPPTSPSPS